ncbi:MAG TPA: DUF4097 family beta strand repeat-containing protein [Pyrinomonadaceae bacterium]|nr:DUF4097 family beta strand repeat-containing protein [Pyrinomonadaceae bacterium]
MRFYYSIIAALLSTLLLCGASAQAQKSSGKGAGRGEGVGRGEGKAQGKGKGSGEGKLSELTVPTTETVSVWLTTGAGNITVRGWDRKEVHAQAKEAGTKFKLCNESAAASASNPAAHVEISLSSGESDESDSDEADSPVLLDVPRGAIVFLKSQEGDLDVEGVTEVHIEAVGGRVDMRRVARAIEVTSIGGDVTLEDSSGRARLNTIGGSIEVKDLRSVDASDFLKAKTASGDILLDRVATSRIEANTISGVIKLEGALAHNGFYNFSTTSGDMTLVIPSDSSFRLTARVSEGGEIVTEFPLKYTGAASPTSHTVHLGRMVGTYGSGDANINLISFSGTLRLRKK